MTYCLFAIGVLTRRLTGKPIKLSLAHYIDCNWVSRNENIYSSEFSDKLVLVEKASKML